MQNAFNAVGCILLLALAGAGVYLLGWVRDEHLPLLSALVIKVALPCMIVTMCSASTRPNRCFPTCRRWRRRSSPSSSRSAGPAAGKAPQAAGAADGRVRGDVRLFPTAYSSACGLAGAVRRGGHPLYAAVLHRQHVAFLGRGLPPDAQMGRGPAGRRQAPPIPLLVILICFLLVFLRFRPPQFIMDACGYLGNMVTRSRSCSPAR